MNHDTAVKYAQETLRGVSLDGWAAKRSGDEIVVDGPCPMCHGEAYGPSLPYAEVREAVMGVLPLDDEPKQSQDIPAKCACGSSHGKDGAQSCGRDWYVPVTF